MPVLFPADEVGSDAQFKQLIEKPIDPQVIDPTKVNTSIVAQVVPASLMPRAINSGQASTDEKP